MKSMICKKHNISKQQTNIRSKISCQQCMIQHQAINADSDKKGKSAEPSIFKIIQKINTTRACEKKNLQTKSLFPESKLNNFNTNSQQINSKKDSFDRIQKYRQRFKRLQEDHVNIQNYKILQNNESNNGQSQIKSFFFQKQIPINLESKTPQSKKISTSQIRQRFLKPQQQKYNMIKKLLINKQAEIEQLNRQIKQLNYQLANKIQKIQLLQLSNAQIKKQKDILSEDVKNLSTQLTNMNYVIQEDIHKMEWQYEDKIYQCQSQLRDANYKNQDLQYKISQLMNENLGLKTCLNEKILILKVIKNIFRVQMKQNIEQTDFQYIKRKINELMRQNQNKERQIKRLSFVGQKQKTIKIQEIQNKNIQQNQVNNHNTLLQELTSKIQNINQLTHNLNQENKHIKAQFHQFKLIKQKEVLSLANTLKYTILQLKKQIFLNKQIQCHKMLKYYPQYKSSIALDTMCQDSSLNKQLQLRQQLQVKHNNNSSNEINFEDNILKSMNYQSFLISKVKQIQNIEDDKHNEDLTPLKLMEQFCKKHKIKCKQLLDFS